MTLKNMLMLENEASFDMALNKPSICNSTEYGSWASYQIRKIAGCACAGNAGNVFPRRRFQRKLLVSDPGMHHGTCVTHVPWCMSGSLTCGDGENVPDIPGACAPAILRIWQEAHGNNNTHWMFWMLLFVTDFFYHFNINHWSRAQYIQWMKWFAVFSGFAWFTLPYPWGSHQLHRTNHNIAQLPVNWPLRIWLKW